MPIRGELFGIERLEEHARLLAAEQLVFTEPAKGHALTGRLADNAAYLLKARSLIGSSAESGGDVTPAAEWLIDNYHLVDMQIRDIGVDLPGGYYSELPKLAAGPLAGLPRVFGASWSLIEHTDSYLDAETVRRYFVAYQDVQTLTIGELWAVPITLRIVLIENLRRVAETIVDNKVARDAANQLADKLGVLNGITNVEAPAILASVRTEVTDAFAVQLSHRLRGQDPKGDPVLSWLDHKLAALGKSPESVVRDELQQQASFNATIRNIINSMRLISDIDWSEAFETISRVDAVLAGHGCFLDMDFPTRNLYRTAIEKMARGSKTQEIDIARLAVAAAEKPGSASAEPGYHLLSGGRAALEDSIGFRPSWGARMRRGCRMAGIAGYGALVVALAITLALLPVWLCGLAGGFWLAVLGILGFIPASDAAVACINRLAMTAFGATVIPGLELKSGIPATLRSLVAVPVLLTSAKSISEHVARLEVHYLANADPQLSFALLSDWTDSPSEHAKTDAELLRLAADGIAALCVKYGEAEGGARFLLLHRARQWNEAEGCWMGWERKRGKLHEMNRLLRGATNTSFIDPPALPGDVRYIVTLDSDTRLPHDLIRRLIGKMAHPLNAPRFDPATGLVVEGYSVLQPRVTPSLPVGRDSSLFQRVFSSMDGIDPYASAVSDVYQDLFGEGSYAGKGIYDIDALERALSGRVPENALLSHDLFEGVFARAGLASDVEVVEEFPTDYAVSAQRSHRWARGDWQLLPWIVNRGLGHGSAKLRAMPAIGRWKMLDNLRRTLSAPAAMLVLLTAFALPMHAALVWAGFVVLTIALPTLLPVAGDLVPRRQWISLRSYFNVLGFGLGHAARLTWLNIVFLAHQAALMGDAICRTLVRLLLTRRRLLQWVSAAQTAEGPRLGITGSYRWMVAAPLIGLIALFLAIGGHPGVWLLALPFTAAWIMSPACAYWASTWSKPPRSRRASKTDIRMLRLTARRTWRYFETFVTASDHMLPPDNFQEDPTAVLARRTSPTNIGLYLLSVASARDFGWIGLADAVDRLEATLATMAGMTMFRGHFYNWYDTTDLRPLEPRYVSTVDSGNLAGHLIALANACREWRGPEVAAVPWRQGVVDAVELAREAASLPGANAMEVCRRLDGLSQAVRKNFVGSGLAEALAGAAAQARALMPLAQASASGIGGDTGADLSFWLAAIERSLESHIRDLPPSTIADLQPRLTALETTARRMAMAMEFGFLRNEARKLLSIGYLVAEEALDANCYDLLASEARLAVYLAIAKGDVPAREWFRLGRAVTPVGDGAALVSWSGSMFEYLMPSLVMRAPTGSLLAATNRRVVQRQIEFAETRGTPWGVSESAYNVRDVDYTYQYSNFGVPGLGLKRGLGQDVVVAPYATMLASMIDPPEAVRNLARLQSAGGRGRYGFYEALDYTPQRVPTGQKVAMVRAFMAHHQGMSILAAADTVFEGIMRTRFHAEPMMEATELLLQERAPRDGAVARPLPIEENRRSGDPRPSTLPGGRRFSTAHQPAPATHLLSNGRYAVMLSTAGSGYSRWNGIAVTRWREDATLDDWGSYIYLRDVQSGAVWSAGLQPRGVEPDQYEVEFTEDRAEFARRDGSITTTMEVLISGEDDAEVRRISISNAGPHTRHIELTSYAELVLAPPATDLAHPAFAKLFVQTEYLAESGAIVATRRRRTPEEPEIWAGHLVVADQAVTVETDRARFIGRGRTPRNPAAMDAGAVLSGTAGTVLDAVFSVRCRVRVPAGASVEVAFWTMVAPTREALIGSIDKHRDTTAFDRASTLAWTRAQVQLRHLGISPRMADLFQRLAGHLLFATPAMRSPSAVIEQGSAAQAALWALGISGDLPIMLLGINDGDDIELARQALLAHEYFRLKLLAVDLVILNDHPASYVQDLQISLEALIRAQSRTGSGPGAVYLLRTDLVAAPMRALLASVARVVLSSTGGRLSEQAGRLSDHLDRVDARLLPMPAAAKQPPLRPAPDIPVVPRLEFANGLGGFAEDGREYVVVMGPGKTTPAPWVNVIANPEFGFQAAAEGSGYTWAGNSRENQLTPWSNDPVTDRPGEAFYLQDSGGDELWCPTASLRRDPAATYVARHGRGYSRFDRIAYGIESSLLQYVPVAAPIKISRLQLHNRSNRSRTIIVTAYAEWVLGPARTGTAPFVITGMDAATGAMFARNPWHAGSGEHVAFADLSGPQAGWTADRREFLGRLGTLSAPVALTRRAKLSGLAGAGLDPCCAMQTSVTLEPDGRAEVIFLLGEGRDAAAAQALIRQYREADLDAVLSDVHRQWDATLGQIQVKTPDRSMDVMLNGWLLYQTLSCRVWARAGFYQASGAFGFRDQLQDGMALVASNPGLVREHLLLAAARQFTQGDVQHWWLPQTGNGVRTRISDDCTWLAYTVAQYVGASGDHAVLDEQVSFLEAPVLTADEHDRFFLPNTADTQASLYDHCALALDHSLATGAHGLPLMGTGDWNDGMSRVGAEGRGESVWLGWFLHTTLLIFATLADERQDAAHATAWRGHARALVAALEDCWDGEWYFRAYFDDGSKLGSRESVECQIDSIAQSWSVISKAAQPDRAARAMQSLERRLVDGKDGIVLVLAPPFDKMGPDPGYISGYPRGVRENGGQYTHAALWAVMATAQLGHGGEAARLFAMLNPINHARTPAEVSRYKAEPYVVSADIYSIPPHTGRAGWSWYTGSAGWMQRVGTESILGVVIRNGMLTVNPCIPHDWPGFEVSVKWRSAQYVIAVENPDHVCGHVAGVTLDGREMPPGQPLSLADDGAVHRVNVRLGA